MESMKSTWKKLDRLRRCNLRVGFLLFVIGTAIAAYCGYMERYVGDEQSDFVKLLGWGSLLAGLVLFLLDIFQGPVRRQGPTQRN